MHKNAATRSSSTRSSVNSERTVAAKSPMTKPRVTARKAAALIDKEVIRTSTSHFRLVLTCIGLSILIVAVALLIAHSFRKNSSQSSAITQPSQKQRSLV